ncbi:DNA ligase D [Pseudolabrys taiwanensis]|uniref:DNA ligase (ATP) n=1 Tax=Pseudolabrys taiwanensis TaxID=331696 RepID=A0A345ZR15_9HYPH|nr:DNA ligase D [Pseudolabrys taiwanensis]AXK79362.1 DNA ligase D [Pseudolabrys taiwanensis]
MAARSTGELKTYNAKRRFGVTAEPKGKVVRKRGSAFVIQKHDATRLHYDLRLELDGVMKSWAVTRGPSLVPGEKRLAVQVEDHPIEYNKFEGTIPEGEYGGGTVMIWDRGTWLPEADPHRGLKKGHLAFTLDGEKLHGGWHLVRMHRRPNEKRDNWLLIKQHDDAERSARDKDILEEAPLSVVTGRSLDEIAEGAPRRGRKKKTTAKPAAKKPTVKTKKPKTKTAGKKKKKASSRAAVVKPLRKSVKIRDDEPEIEDAPVGVLPDFVEPCLATLADKAPDGDAWVHEIKFDGYRLQARLERGNVKLLTRRGLDWTKKFSLVAQAIAKLPAKTALIDGEVVVEGDYGVSSFSLLQQALSSGDEGRMAFYAFDLLHLDGTDLRPLPLTTRKAALGKLLARVPQRGPLRLSESIDEGGPVLLKRACGMGLEGIISKQAMSGYHSGRGHDWLKTKCSDRQEFVVAGFVPSTADARAIGALVLAFYDGGELHYAGRTGTGFSHEVARDLYRTLNARTTKSCPFGTVPTEERGRRRAIWVEPKMVVEVDFRGWTHGDRVRQASFQGVREDKKATEVVREKKASAARAATAVKRSATAKPRASVKKGRATTAQNDDIVGAVKLTHPDRVYWRDAGVTKRDLADYYVKVWEWMAPHLVGRAVALVRCPDGSDFGQCFFQKHVAAGLTPGLLHLVPEKGKKIISIDRLEGLISLVQAGVLEIHTRGSTIDHLDMADRLVFDLDPGPGTTFADVVAAARDVRERLEGIKLKTFVKTTGGKGLHVVLPIKPTPWDEAKTFTRTVAAAMEADEPERYVSTATKSKRDGRIFIDYLRNSREATAVAPYSTRAREGAPVSVPIDWSELGTLKGANTYTVKNIAQRLSRLRKDPWAGIGKVRQPLPKFK